MSGIISLVVTNVLSRDSVNSSSNIHNQWYSQFLKLNYHLSISFLNELVIWTGLELESMIIWVNKFEFINDIF